MNFSVITVIFYFVYKLGKWTSINAFIGLFGLRHLYSRNKIPEMFALVIILRILCKILREELYLLESYHFIFKLTLFFFFSRSSFIDHETRFMWNYFSNTKGSSKTEHSGILRNDSRAMDAWTNFNLVCFLYLTFRFMTSFVWIVLSGRLNV